VSERAVDAAFPTGRLDQLLLNAKLTRPGRRKGTVRRHALIERARASGCRVVGVTAPAGYGKSTLLTEWAHAEQRRVAWVSLDRFDDDPGVLLTLLAAAYAGLAPAAADLVAEMSGLGVSALGRAAPRLAAAFRASPAPFVLMLDDVHELASPACHDVLGVVVSGIPRGSQLVASSRSEQTQLARLRASGDAIEFVAADLALGPDGARQIFSAASIGLTGEEAVSLIARTEGWPVGLHLAALIAQDSGDDPTAITGEDRYVADYLYSESLARLPEGTQRFLRATAVLDQLSAPLCDAVTGEPGAQAQLRSLEAANLFLVPLDRRRGWYRYHALFREFLLGELRRAEPELIPKLHLRAADWYEANGSSAIAVEHLLNTNARERCTQLVAQLTLPTYQAGHMSTVVRWLAALGDTVVESYPPLAVMATWMAVFTDQPDAADRWADIIEGVSFERVPGDGSASFDSARAMVLAAMCRSGPQQMATHAELAIGQESQSSPWRDTALVVGGEAYLLTGDDDRASELFTECSTLAQVMGNPDNFVLAESELASLAMDRGHWAEAAGHGDLASAAVEKYAMQDYPISLPAFTAAARLCVHRGELKEADRQLTRAMRLRPSATYALPWAAVRGRLDLARLHWALSDQTTARHLLREIDDVLIHRPNLGALVDKVSAFRRNIASDADTGTTGGSPLSAAELRLLPYLQTHLTIREIGERLFVSRNTANSEIGAIYRKLGVSSRGDAVQKATAIGLLGE
jgi:LuxR family maltose regulon positive regulatory protein